MDKLKLLFHRKKQSGEGPEETGLSMPCPGRDMDETVTATGTPAGALEDSGMFLASDQHIGGRASQQDVVRRDLCMGRAAAVVCDGMGGMESGGRASTLAADMIFSALWEKPPEQDPESCMINAACRADEAVARLEDEKGRIINSGTTAVAVYAEKGMLNWLSVGDSRIYRLRETEFSQLTRDHNYLLYLTARARAGEISMEEAQSDIRREALISYVGRGGMDLMDTGRFDLLPGDLVLLCSDGLYKALEAEEIGRILADCGENPAACVKTLVSEALRKGGPRQDNTTVALLYYRGND